MLVIEGRSVKSLGDFFVTFASHRDVPEYFGRNLDALEEVLAERLCPDEIVWADVSVSREALGSAFGRLAKVLSEHSTSQAALGDEWRLKFR